MVLQLCVRACVCLSALQGPVAVQGVPAGVDGAAPPARHRRGRQAQGAGALSAPLTDQPSRKQLRIVGWLVPRGRQRACTPAVGQHRALADAPGALFPAQWGLVSSLRPLMHCRPAGYPPAKPGMLLSAQPRSDPTPCCVPCPPWLQAVQLALQCLSFDFVGTCLDESSEDLGTIQVPSGEQKRAFGEAFNRLSGHSGERGHPPLQAMFAAGRGVVGWLRAEVHRWYGAGSCVAQGCQWGMGGELSRKMAHCGAHEGCQNQ